ncbi:hypothetical protein [Flavobacterium sp.]|uniref:hypothetical protein n=1 Tax=Flavobacterium sp. TaxID=239 RepID=UPI00262B5759|nr:hypothetical protein [Flavobacterium sp.]
MKANEDKLLEKLVDNMMQDSVLEDPSADFTAKVMSHVLKAKKSNIYVYKPLISKPVFVLILGCFIGLFIYLFINRETQTNSWVDDLNFKTVYYNYAISLFNFSKITIYSVILATFFLFIQILFLRKHFYQQYHK